MVTVPGVLYVIASIGLARRRYRAWVMSLSVTLLLLVALLVTLTYLAIFETGGALVFFPGVFLLAMPGLILIYMLRAMPVLREADLLGAKGFLVLPVARRAEPKDSDPS